MVCVKSRRNLVKDDLFYKTWFTVHQLMMSPQT